MHECSLGYRKIPFLEAEITELHKVLLEGLQIWQGNKVQILISMNITPKKIPEWSPY